MAFANFKPTYWAEKIERENAKLCVAKLLCNTRYEGELGRAGTRVKVPAIGGVTVGDYTGAQISYETLADTSVYLTITEQKYFAFAVDDIDKAQSNNDFISVAMKEANEALAEKEDGHILATIADEAGNKPAVIASLSTNGARKAIRAARTTLLKKNVKKTTQIVAVVDPDVAELLEDEVENLRTNNDNIVENGYVGRTAGVDIYVSNNLPEKTILVFTKDRAVSHASQINEVGAERIPGKFEDGVKGLNCYGTKVIRPKEVVKMTYTAL